MRTFLLVIGVALIAGSAAYAHHSYAATYDVTKEVKLEGKLVQFVLRNDAWITPERALGAFEQLTLALQRWRSPAPVAPQKAKAPKRKAAPKRKSR